MILEAKRISCNGRTKLVTAQPVAKFAGKWQPLTVLGANRFEFRDGGTVPEPRDWYVFCTVATVVVVAA